MRSDRPVSGLGVGDGARFDGGMTVGVSGGVDGVDAGREGDTVRDGVVVIVEAAVAGAGQQVAGAVGAEVDGGDVGILVAHFAVGGGYGAYAGRGAGEQGRQGRGVHADVGESAAPDAGAVVGPVAWVASAEIGGPAGGAVADAEEDLDGAAGVHQRADAAGRAG